MRYLDIIAIISAVTLALTILLNFKLNSIMATQAELAQQLRDINTQNEKSRVEILQKIADLEAALANAGNTTPEVDEAVAALKASVQTDDDIVPDQI
jgi:hypothetical protein